MWGTMTPFRCAFAGVAIAASRVAVSGSPDLTSEAIDTGSLTVTKTVFSSKMRFFFPVGLEGAGHDYIEDVVKYFDTNKNLDRVPGHDNVESDAYEILNSMGSNVQHYSKSLNIAKENMRSLAKSSEEVEFPGTVLSLHGRNGQNSYPNGTGPNKALKYVDLRMIAEVAEQEGVDFRVLYMRRPVKDILIADTIHRRFQTGLHNKGNAPAEEKYMQYMQILFTDIAVLHSFVSELGPGFVVCHDFDRLGDMDQAAMVSNFLAPNEDVAAILNDSFIISARDHPKSNETLLYDGADVIASRLQRKFDVFESVICSGESDLT